jgi:hypothetical protein
MDGEAPMRNRAAPAMLLLAGAFVLASCGGDNGSDSGEANTEQAEAAVDAYLIEADCDSLTGEFIDALNERYLTEAIPPAEKQDSALAESDPKGFCEQKSMVVSPAAGSGILRGLDENVPGSYEIAEVRTSGEVTEVEVNRQGESEPTVFRLANEDGELRVDAIEAPEGEVPSAK